MSRALVQAILVAILAATAAHGILAQTVVQWNAKLEPAAVVKPGANFEAVLEARIEPGWHLYALTQDAGGPQALVIAVPPESPFKLAGPVIAPLPITAPDANFNIDTQYHAEEATFYVPLTVPANASGRTPLDLDVTFQTCTDRFCLPPRTERLSVSLLVPGTGAAAGFVICIGSIAPTH
jgi:thiol:disulfide interchange protein DsbD